ncbi:MULTISPECIES: thioredoxin TrxC [unclassified Sulfurospirillum]|uniref:thioredoxin TrxC n=1 Tax=unclassified Sulfurospirillum TaxID=2618290 RepID=UPI00050544A5|nr:MULTISPECIES: thioredoxin TrxC [unclassified Sulfurospirillum]KFL34704.1 thioredoxin 2 [Sulfurospirillum sp. SCADC]
MKVICPNCLATNNVPKLEVYKKANCGKCQTSLLDPHPIALTSDILEAVLSNTDVPVIVDFWAPWCAPCKAFAPTFQQAARVYPLRVLFAKVDTEAEQFLASRFKIRSIPTLIVFKDGEEVERVSGAMSDEDLDAFVERFL